MSDPYVLLCAEFITITLKDYENAVPLRRARLREWVKSTDPDEQLMLAICSQVFGYPLAELKTKLLAVMDKIDQGKTVVTPNRKSFRVVVEKRAFGVS